jgi:Kef-type K+ transport system membrane component KefB
LQGLLAVVTVVALVPFLARPFQGRVPTVALLMLGGIAVGPSGLGWLQPNAAIDLFSNMGLGLIFALIGLTIDQKTLGDTAGRLGFLGWLATLGIGTPSWRPCCPSVMACGPCPSWWLSAPRPCPPWW